MTQRPARSPARRRRAAHTISPSRRTDSIANTGSQAYTVTIGTNSLTVNPASLPNGTQNVAYSQTRESRAAAAGPYTFAVSSGALPAGLSLNANTGAITGTPTGSGPSAFTIRATDTRQQFRHPRLQRQHRHQFADDQSGDAAGGGRRQAVQRHGGRRAAAPAPYAYSVSAGALPPGLTLNASTGVISGTVDAAGSYSFTIQALDVNGNTGSRAYTLTNRPDPALDPEVIGLVNAQVAAARRFASAQIDNLSRHLERLHNFNPCSVDFGVSLPPTGDTRGQLYPGELALQPVAGQCRALLRRTPNSPAGQVARRMPGSQDCEDNGGWTSRLAALGVGLGRSSVR